MNLEHSILTWDNSIWNANVVEFCSRAFNSNIQYVVHTRNSLARSLVKESQNCMASVAELWFANMLLVVIWGLTRHILFSTASPCSLYVEISKYFPSAVIRLYTDITTPAYNMGLHIYLGSMWGITVVYFNPLSTINPIKGVICSPYADCFCNTDIFWH